MYKLLIALFFVSTAYSAEFLAPSCTEEMIEAHKARVRSAIVAKVKYPRLAARRGWAGRGVVYFEFSNVDPEPAKMQVIQSTGYSILDDEIIRAIKSVELPATICSMGDKKFGVWAPVDFRLPEPKIEQQENNPSPNPSPIPVHESTS